MQTPQIVVHQPMLLGESPIWHPLEQVLYWVDIDGLAVHRYKPQGAVHDSWSMPSQPGCIAWCAEGGLLMAMRSGLARLDTTTGELAMMAAPPYDPATMRFNDGRCDSAGRFWTGAIYEPRDQVAAPLFVVERGEIRDSGKRATVSNGMAFSPDGKVQYHSDTKAHRICAYDFDMATGTHGETRLLHQFDDDKSAPDYGGRPDGAAVDAEGAYWCAMYEGARLLRLSPAGDILAEVPLPFRCPTMMAFGGTDLRTLYITSARHGRPADEIARYPLSGVLMSLPVDVPGLPEQPYFA
ncbi:MAG: SMP-30/gluconolactonase/LRE family protein [Janthinobacterium lividum]